MKITLISIYPDLWSFGLRTVSSILKKEGNDVDLIFMPREFVERFPKEAVKDLVELTKDSHWAGISLMSNFWDNAIQLTEAIKENCKIPVMWGGTHATVRPNECLKHADMVCVGESEEALMEFSRKFKNKENFYDIKGMGFNKNGEIIVNGLRELPGSKKAEIQTLDDIPFQDFDYETHYVLDENRIKKMDTNLFRKHWDHVYMTQPTRGCPFACTFCVNNTLLAMHPHQKPIRKRSVDNIILELKLVTAKVPFIKKILFDDDAFFLMTIDEIEDFSKKYKEQIGLPLRITGATPSTLHKTKLSLLADAGLREMRMGIQTAGSDTKQLYKRPHTNDQVEKAVRMVYDQKNVEAKYDIILDSPWDTEPDTIETLMFLSKLPAPYMLTLFSLVLFPGTDLYNKAKKEGIIKDDVNDIYRKHYHGVKKTYLNSLFMLIKDYVAVDSHLINTTVMSFLVNKKIKFINRPAALLLRLIFPLFKIKYLISKLGLIKTIKRLITNPRLLSIFPKNLNIFKSIFNKKQTYDVVTPATED